MRASVEKGLAQTRDAYAKAKVVADESAAALETSYAAARAGVAAINAKAFDTLRANVEANFDFLKSSFAAASRRRLCRTAGRVRAPAHRRRRRPGQRDRRAGPESGDRRRRPIKAQVAKTFSLVALSEDFARPRAASLAPTSAAPPLPGGAFLS